jgi:hypothetical protein
MESSRTDDIRKRQPLGLESRGGSDHSDGSFTGRPPGHGRHRYRRFIRLALGSQRFETRRQVTLECLAEEEYLNPLVKPRYGKLSSRRNTCIYRPRANRTGEDSFAYATKAGVATLRLMLESNTKASTRIAYVMNDTLPARQGVPMRLTVQSEREAPTLTLTDRAPTRDQETGGIR